MIDVTCEGTEFKYLSAQDIDNGEGTEFTAGLQPAVAERLRKGRDTRLVLFRNLLPPHQWIPYWLVWQNPPDLSALDERARKGLYSAEDFGPAFRTIPQRIRCPKCGQSFQTLLIDAGDPYPNAPELHRKKIARLRILPCPNCGSSLRQLVAKIIDE